MSSRWLVLVDCSIQGAAIGFTPLDGDQKGCVAWAEVTSRVQDSAAKLPGMFDRGKASLGIAADEVVGFVIGSGPGSFTGLRVGLAYAYGLSIGLSCSQKVPLLWRGVSSLALLTSALALQYGGDTDLTLALPSTKSTGYFAIWCPALKSCSLQTVDLLPEANFSGNFGDVIILGTWPELQNRLREMPAKVLDVEEATRKALAAMALDSVTRWPSGFSAEPPELNYMKRSTVEEKAQQKL